MDPTLHSLFNERLTSIDRQAPTPLYFQLFTVLRNMIIDGTLPHGARIPTEEQLASTFHVSRITAKRSVDELAKEGLVERHRGKGSHVIYTYKPKPVRAPLTGMLQEIESMARNSDATVLECSMRPPPQEIREELNLESGQSALHLVRIREREGRKFGFYLSWTGGVAMPDDPKLFEREPRLSFFRQHGLDISHVTQTLSACSATPELATALDIAPGSALLTLVRRSYNTLDNIEHMYDHLAAYYNPEHFQYKMDLKVE
ncbi:MAG: GntR family transcriptional regulator [Cellvibrionaceae bacterium]|nr:GntR family transcriptional regulator [Cellvibrionaceae bacterium]